MIPFRFFEFCLLYLSFCSNCITGFDPDYSIVNRLNHFIEATLNTVLSVRLEERAIEEEVTFWAATPDQQEYVKIHLHDPDISDKLDISLPVVFIIHGWFDSAHRTWVKSIVATFLETTDTNVVAVDWNKLALQEYTLAAESTRDVGEYLGRFVSKLNDLGISLDDVTLVGHSMGSHIAGYAGASLDGEIGQIYGLDPAGPMFTKLTVQPEDKRLDPSDAQFVQVIHTDKGFIGAQIALGHQDFYPNDGLSPQPGCLIPAAQNAIHFNQFLCSHFKVVEYFRDSLMNIEYVGLTCSLGYLGYSLGLCNNNTSAKFGINTDKTVRGKFYFKTPRIPPSFDQFLELGKDRPNFFFG